MSDTFRIEDEIPAESPKSGLGCAGFAMVGCGFLIVLAVVAVIAIRTWVLPKVAEMLEEMTSDDPVVLREWVADIIPGPIPEGYVPEFGWRPQLGPISFAMVVVKPDPLKERDKLAHFILFQGPPGANDAELKQQFRNELENEGFGDHPNRQPDSREIVEITVGDRTFEAEKTTWVGEAETRISYMLVPIPGVIFSASGIEDSFDQQAFEAFLAATQAADVPETKQSGDPPSDPEVEAPPAEKPETSPDEEKGKE